MLGITNCAPLWANVPTSGGDSTNLEYRGAYCIDMFPTSEDEFFVQKYYKPEEGAHVDYLIFTEDEAFENNDFSIKNGSNVRGYMQELVFANTTSGR